jgi:hypothetical protein
VAGRQRDDLLTLAGEKRIGSADERAELETDSGLERSV